MTKIYRTLVFIVFFGIGTAAFSLSLLSDSLVKYYQNKHLVKQANTSLEKLKTLIDDYDVLLSQIEKDPNMIRRVAPVTLGTEPNEPNTIYPDASKELLIAAKKALGEEGSQKDESPVLPNWLQRCSESRRRIILFVAGAALIIISFMFFANSEKQVENEQ